MLDNGKGGIVGILKFIDQIHAGIHVYQIVVRQFFAVQLGKHSFQITVERSLLMRIFAVPEMVAGQFFEIINWPFVPYVLGFIPG